MPTHHDETLFERYQREESFHENHMENRVAELEAQLAESQKIIVLARDALYLPCDRWNAIQFKIVKNAIKAIDDSKLVEGLVLCDAAPVGVVTKHTGSLKDMAIIVWHQDQPAEGTELYAARRTDK